MKIGRRLPQPCARTCRARRSSRVVGFFFSKGGPLGGVLLAPLASCSVPVDAGPAAPCDDWASSFVASTSSSMAKTPLGGDASAIWEPRLGLPAPSCARGMQ